MNDLKFAFRQLMKSPGFTAVAVITLALGIGATTAIFSVVYAVLLRPLPYEAPEQLARIYSEFPLFPNGGLRRFSVSPPEYLELKREAGLWESVEAWVGSGVNVSAEARPVRATAALVTGGLMQTLGARPMLGRGLTPEDDRVGAGRVATLSHGLWLRAFGGDPGIVGRDIRVNGDKVTVVGVMPPAFQFPPGALDPAELWSPLQLDPANPGGRTEHFLNLLGRLKPGVNLAQAQSELSSLAKHWGETGSDHRFDLTNHTIVAHGLHDEVVRGVRPALRMLLGAVAFLLLIACVNVANLLLAHAESRQREIAIRGALGAGLGRLTIQFLIEGILLSLVGVVAGVFLAYGGLELLRYAGASSIPRSEEIGIDARVVLFAVGVALLTGLVFGLTPLIHTLKRDLHYALKSAGTATTGTSGIQRFRQALVAGELALALTLLIGTGLMLRAFWNLQDVDGGFDPKGVVTMSVELPNPAYRIQQVSDFWTRLLPQLATLPGVESAALASGLPPVYGSSHNDTLIEGFVPTPNGPIQNVEFYQSVSPGYFETLRVRLLDGRFFDQSDGPDAPGVVIINQTMARTFWGNERVVGRRVRPGGTTNWCTVVGVIADAKNGGLEKPTGTELYLPYSQSAGRGRARRMNILLRSPATTGALVAGVRSELAKLDASLPVNRVRTMDEVIAAARSRPRFLTLLLTLFAGVALILAAVGIYGVISYSVARQTREFGLRMALGAQRGDMLGLVLGRGLVLALIGIGVGLVSALLLTRFLSTMLFGVTPTDPATFTVVSLALGGVAMLATYIPARRAMRVDPMVALRVE